MLRHKKGLLEGLSPRYGIEVKGHTAITLGCTACKHRATIEVPTIGPSLTMQTSVPVALEAVLKVDTPHYTLNLPNTLEINQDPCEDASVGICPFGDAVRTIVEKYKQSPDILESTFEPPRITF